MTNDSSVPAVWESGDLPGIARIAGRAWLRSAGWALESGARSARNLGRAMTNPAAAGELVHDLAVDVADATRAVGNVATAVSNGVPLPRAVFEASVSLSAREKRRPTSRPATEDDLRERGEQLLRRSRDVWSEDTSHPAYARIIDDMAPDEARILLLLLRGGPQPSVDVRTGGPTSLLSSSLIASGMSMIGPRAGVRHLDAVPAYLNNLFRLGLIWFSSEQVENPLEYQVVEAQPDVLDAMHSVRSARLVRRSIHLTPFGVNFCTACLVDVGDVTTVPKHQLPDDTH